MSNYQRKSLKIVGVFFLGLLLVIIGSIPVKMAIARYQQPKPQAIFVLGGGPYREEFAARFARSRPFLPIWISSGLKEAHSRQVFDDAGVSLERLNLDHRATDTVTNFTTLVADFKEQKIQHLYLITSDYHLPRSKAIASIILGSRGIAFTPIAMPTKTPPEPRVKILRDVGRALLWLFTGRTGSSLSDR